IARDDTQRKLMEDRLREHDEFSRSILEASPDCVKVLDLDGNLVSINGPGLCVMEIDEFSEFKGKCWSDFWKGEKHAEALAAVEAAERGVTSRFHGYAETAKGTLKYWDVVVTPILNAAGQPKQLLSVSRDITRRKRAEQNTEFLLDINETLAGLSNINEMMRVTGEKIWEFLGVAHCAFVEIDEAADAAVIRYDWRKDDNAVSLIGTYRMAEYVSEDFQRTLVAGLPVIINDVASDPRTAASRENFRKLRLGSLINTPYVRDGSLKFVLGVYQPEAYEWRADEVVLLRELSARIWLIIERKQTEEALRKSESHLRRAHLEAEAARLRLHDLFMQAPAIICTLRGPEHVFELANPLYLQLVGRHDVSELIGRPVREALPEVEGQGFLKLLDKVYRTGEPVIGNEVSIMLDRQGNDTLEEVFLNFVYQPSRGTVGEIEGILVHAVEVTEQVRSRQRVEEASRIKDEFLATLSHELRTPLTAILGWARMLSGGQLDERHTARALETIERNAIAQSQLIEDILDVSRVITGKLRLEVQPVDLNALIESSIDAVLPAADAKSIRLQRVFDAGASIISGDPARLQQVIWNLLSNAIKFTPKEGTVQIKLERVNSYVEMTVTDNGQGIDANVLPYIFERFRQADSTSTRKHSGLGLGLAIVRHLVETHGGTVEAASAGQGQGATFTVSLPLIAVRSLDVRHSSADERVHPTSSPGVPFDCPVELDGLHILIADDEEDTRLLLKMVLEQCGASVTSVSSARAALAALKESRPDVLLSDLGMPDEDGYSLIKRVRALPTEDGGQTPAAALTAYARVEDRVKVLHSGFQMHIPKPVEPTELVTVVANLAGRIGKG
ncbi:MAG: ATP-binding protein, partial [Pyrinomonadaceae bacterium]